mmetsp:Transcript_52689/g.171318  ORF Transcript_52689/g.171318 Transcript_52689/m.171318 type:complete len:239 (-) Transcript_52689:541-1257(-)
MLRESCASRIIVHGILVQPPQPAPLTDLLPPGDARARRRRRACKLPGGGSRRAVVQSGVLQSHFVPLEFLHEALLLASHLRDLHRSAFLGPADVPEAHRLGPLARLLARLTGPVWAPLLPRGRRLRRPASSETFPEAVAVPAAADGEAAAPERRGRGRDVGVRGRRRGDGRGCAGGRAIDVLRVPDGLLQQGLPRGVRGGGGAFVVRALRGARLRPGRLAVAEPREEAQQHPGAGGGG